MSLNVAGISFISISGLLWAGLTFYAFSAMVAAKRTKLSVSRWAIWLGGKDPRSPKPYQKHVSVPGDYLLLRLEHPFLERELVLSITHREDLKWSVLFGVDDTKLWSGLLEQPSKDPND